MGSGLLTAGQPCLEYLMSLVVLSYLLYLRLPDQQAKPRKIEKFIFVTQPTAEGGRNAGRLTAEPAWEALVWRILFLSYVIISANI